VRGRVVGVAAAGAGVVRDEEVQRRRRAVQRGRAASIALDVRRYLAGIFALLLRKAGAVVLGGGDGRDSGRDDGREERLSMKVTASSGSLCSQVAIK
jgi:hypothetical protein